MTIVFIQTNRNENTIPKYYINILFNSTEEKGMLQHYHEMHRS
jgi:hypothetical protein